RSVIEAEFATDRNIDSAAADVRAKVSAAKESLPDGCDDPVVEKSGASGGTVIFMLVTASGRTDIKNLTEYAEDVVSERMKAVHGAGGVQVLGGRRREIKIWVNTNSLESYGLTAGDIRDAIRARHVELPAGRLETGEHVYGIRLKSEYGSAAGLSSMPVAYRGGVAIRLGDVARVEDGLTDRRNQGFYGSSPAVIVAVGKQKDANEMELSREVLRRVDELNKTAPPGVRIEVISDTSRFIRRSMSGVRNDIMLSVCLTSIIMFMFLRTIRAAIIAAITIPVCLLGSAAVLYRMGVTINNMSMMGLSLAVGMIVDATSVVMENISRHRSMGKNPASAVTDGSGEVAAAVIAGVLTTLAAVIPAAFAGGAANRLLATLALTFAVAIAISLLLSLTLTPFLCSRMLGREKHGFVQEALEAPFTALEHGYRKLLVLAVSHRCAAVVLGLLAFSGGIWLAGSLGSEFTPNEDMSRLRVNITLPPDTSLEVTERTVADIRKSVEADPGVAYTYSIAGDDWGQALNGGTINIELKPKNQRGKADVIMGRLRQKLAMFRDAGVSMGMRGASDIALTVQGQDNDKLVEIGGLIKGGLAGNPRGLADVTAGPQPKPRINLGLNRALADDLGVNVRGLSEELNARFGGVDAGSLKDGGSKYNIRIRAEKDLRDDRGEIANTLVRTAGGKLIRAEGLISSSIEPAPSVITRYNRRKSLTISANLDGIPASKGIAVLREEFQKYAPQDGAYTIAPAGDAARIGESFRSMTVALCFAMLMVYSVMAIQFESFLHPFTIMFSLPLMAAGSFGLMRLVGLHNSVMSFMGVILLAGVVVNNAIILVDFINRLRAGGMKKVDAVIAGGPLRLRAILITSVSTIIGNLPVALALSEGSGPRQPLAVTVIGGLSTSTFLTLFVIPVIYLIFDDIKDWCAGKIRRYNAYRRLRGRGAYGSTLS
ncbi:MAG: efflux RND transporter permease subunit, partial [Synergistaceae bacterium]|nr:efflux RND transporter permease subunit [Synergistaceae bacterium]